MKLNKVILHILVSLALASSASFVYADGEATPTPTPETREVCTTTYGGGRTCEKVDVPREEIVHPTVETGIVENAILAGGLFLAGYIVLLLAKRYEIIK